MSSNSENGNAVLGLLVLIALYFGYRWWNTPTWYVMNMQTNTCMDPNSVPSSEKSPSAMLNAEKSMGDDVIDSGLQSVSQNGKLYEGEAIADRSTGRVLVFFKGSGGGKELCAEASAE